MKASIYYMCYRMYIFMILLHVSLIKNNTSTCDLPGNVRQGELFPRFVVVLVNIGPLVIVAETLSTVLRFVLVLR